MYSGRHLSVRGQELLNEFIRHLPPDLDKYDREFKIQHHERYLICKHQIETKSASQGMALQCSIFSCAMKEIPKGKNRRNFILNDDYENIRFIRLQSFASLDAFPRYPDCQDITTKLSEIDRNNSLLVFVSHHWLRGHFGCEGWDGSPHLDNCDGDKFKLCVTGICEVWTTYAPRMKDCYIWVDFGCMDQSCRDLTPELENYDRIVECCDCLFTPFVSSANSKEYYKRAWCRVERMFAAHIPVLDNEERCAVSRHTMFEDHLAHECRENRRPHFYSNSCYAGAFISVEKPLHFSHFQEYHPLKGDITNPSDMVHIARLVADLQKYIDAQLSSVGYTGDKNERGENHGWGIMVYENGDRYEGKWKNDLWHGKGTYSKHDGTVYEGNWENGKRIEKTLPEVMSQRRRILAQGFKL